MYYNKAKTLDFHSMVKYATYHICIIDLWVVSPFLCFIIVCEFDSPRWCVAIVSRPSWELNISCTSTTAESKTKISYYFMSNLVLQSSWWGRESWLLCLVCLARALWLLCSSSSRCHVFIYSLWLWYFLIILTYYFAECMKGAICNVFNLSKGMTILNTNFSLVLGGYSSRFYQFWSSFRWLL